MAYKKYFYKNGKRFGPYYYESYRDETGKVKKRYVGTQDPHKKRVTPTRFLFFFSLGIGILSLLLIGNLNYSLDITGRVVDQNNVEDLFSNVTENEKTIAENIARGTKKSSRDIRGVVDVAVSSVGRTKKMDFVIPEGTIKLTFDLLNYSEFVLKDLESEVSAEEFDIEVSESTEEYKWGYVIQLTDPVFMARVDITSEVPITVIDNQTFRIGRQYLSFSDLAQEGYSLAVAKPIVLENVSVVVGNITGNLTGNFSEVNVTVNESIIIDDVNVSIGNETITFNVTENEIVSNESEEILSNETLIVSNETEGDGNETIVGEESGNESAVNVTDEELGEDDESEVDSDTNETEEVNDSNETEIVEDEEKEIGGEAEEEAEGEIVEDEEKKEEKEKKDKKDEEESSDESESDSDSGITPLAFILGFIQRGYGGLAGFVVQEEHYTISLYIQKDFTNTSTAVGDVITLDPTIITTFASEDVTACGHTMDTEGTTYILQNDVSASTATCFTIGAHNITIDLNGSTLDGNNLGAVYGIDGQAGHDNITIANGTIKEFGSTGSASGIYMNNNKNLVIRNITAYDNDNSGIHINGNSPNASIENSNLSNNNKYWGINFNSQGGRIINVTANANDDGGIYVLQPDVLIVNATTNYQQIGIRLKSNTTIINSTAHNNTDYGFYLNTVSNNVMKGNVISNTTIGIYMQTATHNNTIENNIFKFHRDGIQIANGNNNSFINNTFIDNTFGIRIGSSADNLLMNNQFYNNSLSIEDPDANANYSFIYNNSFGTITWINSTDNFLGNTTLNGTLTFPGTINISNNSVSVNLTAFNRGAINSSGNITLYNIGVRDISYPVILHEGTNVCNMTTTPKCHNYTALDADTVIFNISSWSNYSIGSGPDVTVPLLNITYPANITYTVNVTFLNYTITDPNRHRCWYSRDGGVTNSTHVACGVNFTGVVSVEESNTWTLFANDTSGNQNRTNRTFYKSVPPNVSFGTGTANDGVSVAQSSIYVNVSVIEDNEQYIVFRLANNAGVLLNTSKFSAGQRTINWSGLTDASYRYNVSVNDTLGNINDTERRVITLDNGGSGSSSSGGGSSSSSGGGSSSSSSSSSGGSCISQWQCSDWGSCGPSADCPIGSDPCNGPVYTDSCNGADINGDGVVDGSDLSIQSAYWQQSNCSSINEWCSRADINKDGIVDDLDLSAISQQWGISCTLSLLESCTCVETQTCVDQNACSVPTNVPVTERLCGSECISEWDCGDWEACVPYENVDENVEGLSSLGPFVSSDDLVKVRECIDANGCDGNTKKEVKECFDDPEGFCDPNWECGDWGECTLVYGFDTVITDDLTFIHEEERACEDVAGCTTHRIERQLCEPGEVEVNQCDCIFEISDVVSLIDGSLDPSVTTIDFCDGAFDIDILFGSDTAIYQCGEWSDCVEGVKEKECVNTCGGEDIVETELCEEQCSISLVPGWNFVSPGCVEDVDLDDFFSQITGTYRFVLVWGDETGQFSGWSSVSGKPLLPLDVDVESFFIYYTGLSRTIDIEGSLRRDFSVPLLPRGWSSPVWPYPQSDPLNTNVFYKAPLDIVLIWDKHNQLFKGWNVKSSKVSDLQTIPGEGYFIGKDTNEGERRLDYFA